MTRTICFFSMMLALTLSSVGCRNAAPEPDADGTNKTPATRSSDKTPTPDPAAKNSAPEKSDSDSQPDPKTATSESGTPTGPEFTQTIPETLIEFEMVLVPGDESEDIKPFYIGRKEVSWDEFAYWALYEGMSKKDEVLEREKALRPSPPHDVAGMYRGWGRANQPAVGMSWLSAENYCKWLSQQTGRKYRLPTSDEWSRAFTQGGGTLDKVLETSELEKMAWFEGNSFDAEKFDNRAMALATLAPNSLGVYDMLGNVAEWVTGTSDRHIARGGSFLTEAEELTGAHEDVEDQTVWNKNYPRDPKSEWWYFDADFVGFRVVCEGE